MKGLQQAPEVVNGGALNEMNPSRIDEKFAAIFYPNLFPKDRKNRKLLKYLKNIRAIQ